MIEALIRYWKGYVQIRIEGDSPERFLNLCRYHNLILWNLHYEESGVTCFLFLKDFWKLKSLVRKSGVRVLVIKRRGLPFFIGRNKKRKAAYVSACLSFIGIYILSLFLWDIQFEGNIHYTDDVLMQFLNRKGYVHGMRLSDITCEELEKEIRNEYNDINWVSAMIEGTRLVVKIKENSGILEENEQQENPAGNLVADKDGTVVSIITRNGTPLVHAGDSVQAGDVLVSGKVELKNDAGEVENTHLVQADADVIVEYQDTYEEQFPMLHEVRQYTGETINYFLQLFDHRFQIMPAKRKENMEIYTERKQIHLFSNFYIPLYYGTSTVRTYEMTEAVYSEEEARTLAEKNWEQYLTEQTKRGADVVWSSVAISVEEGQCIASGTLTVREKIGVWADIRNTEE
ncbi:MAG: sporulation protein YqfD [Lachnospiraceae bacterium]